MVEKDTGKRVNTISISWENWLKLVWALHIHAHFLMQVPAPHNYGNHISSADVGKHTHTHTSSHIHHTYGFILQQADPAIKINGAADLHRDVGNVSVAVHILEMRPVSAMDAKFTTTQQHTAAQQQQQHRGSRVRRPINAVCASYIGRTIIYIWCQISMYESGYRQLDTRWTRICVLYL